MIQYNYLLITFLTFFIFTSLCRYYLTRLNITHMKKFGQNVPEVFKEEIDEGTMSRITEYTVESSYFSSIVRFVDEAVLLVFLLSGILP